MNSSDSGPIFILGCARSGTTWLGRIFAETPGFTATIEDPVIFPLVDEAVLFWDRGDHVLERLLRSYREQIVAAGANAYVDKSHQNIWLAESLLQTFPTSRFVAVERTPYGVIASMMRHAAVLRHFRCWRDYPLPNRHLGISIADAAVYDEVPLVVRCAMRWRSHHDRLITLRATLAERLHVVNYERLIEDSERELAALSRFVGAPLRPGEPNRESLTKWRDVLSASQLARIDRELARVSA